MSVDHKPGRKAESRRILRSGGYLDETDPRNPRVVCDSLNVRGEQASCMGRSNTLVAWQRVKKKLPLLSRYKAGMGWVPWGGVGRAGSLLIV